MKTEPPDQEPKEQPKRAKRLSAKRKNNGQDQRDKDELNKSIKKKIRSLMDNLPQDSKLRVLEELLSEVSP